MLFVILIFEIFTLYLFKKEENRKRLDTWLGEYYYSAKSDEGWREYEISIFKINENYYAELTCSCDLRIEIRLLGYVKGNENSIEIFFRDILPGDSLYENNRYKKDELLVVLTYEDMELQTSWYAFRQNPDLCNKEEEIEGIYFKKIEWFSDDK